MADDELRVQSLTIYLAKPHSEAVEELIEDIGGLVPYPISDETGPLGILYVEKRYAGPPGWGRFFLPQIKLTDLGTVSSSAGIFYCLMGERAVVLTFDQGRYRVKTENCDDRFGLRVTLNSVGENKLRSMDVSTLDTGGRHSRVQTSQESSTSDFGIDVERDLLRALTGAPADKALGNSMTGFDSLHVRARVDLSTLRGLLARYLEQADKPDYKVKFPWVEHVGEVKDPVRMGELDELMVAAIAEERTDKCWLAVPVPVDWNRIAGFRYGKNKRLPERHDLHLSKLFEDHGMKPGDLTVEFLRAHEICAFDDGNGVPYHWSIYRCLYCEIEDEEETFLFSFGRWYKLSSNFVKEINDFFATEVPHVDLGLPVYKDISERAYNERVISEKAGEYALMDGNLIMIGGGHSSLEFCDLMSRTNDLIHIKRYGGSGVLSHLFAQGLNSGVTYASVHDFRNEVNARLPVEFRLADPLPRPDTADYRVVFAVVSAERGDGLTLPFFSRLSLRYAYRTLRGFGYQVALAKIPVDEAFIKLQKGPTKRART